MTNTVETKTANKKTRKVQVVDVVTATFLYIFAISLIVLMVWGIFTSFKSYADFERGKNYFGLPNMTSLGAKDALAFGN